MTHRERILRVMRGEMVDVIPFVPRLDLWYMSNALRGTLPERFKNMKHDDIARMHGWALYRMVPDFVNMIRGPEDILHRAIGLYRFQQSAYRWEFSSDVEVKVSAAAGQQVVEYHTPLGMVRTVGGLTEEMKRRGASLGWTQEHIIQKPSDYRVVGHIFENIRVYPNPDGFTAYQDETGDDGVVAAGGASLAASPMHHIQKEFLDHTRFFYEYEDNKKLMRELAERVEVYFDKVLAVMEDSPAEVVMWGANYDDTITYPPYFEREILPWLRKASERLGARGKIMATHTDGENFGLMDLIRDSGAHVAESITPHPMTKVKIEEYYRRWRERLTLFGGIPECMVLEETAGREEFEGYLDHLFKAVAPGDRMIFGIADSTPPGAVFERLVRIGERIEKECRLPLKAGDFRPVSEGGLREAAAPRATAAGQGPVLGSIRDDVLAGDRESLKARITRALEDGLDAQEILNRGMVPAMEIIGERFKNGEAFIPDVLLAARAMNGGMELLEPSLASGTARTARRAKVLIGTVAGDMHDIGKNMVATMLKGTGFEVKDLGINVALEEFLRAAEEYRPDIIALSALLTTTMPEMKRLIDALSERGMRAQTKVLVGGAPVNERYAREIGADGYAPNAADAVEAARAAVKG